MSPAPSHHVESQVEKCLLVHPAVPANHPEQNLVLPGTTATTWSRQAGPHCTAQLGLF